MSGKTVVDITKPLKPDMSGLVVGFTSSAPKEIQQAVPDARIVKAFNTVFAQVLGAEATPTTRRCYSLVMTPTRRRRSVH